MKVHRDDKDIEVELTLGEQPQEEIDSNTTEKDDSKSSNSLRDYYDRFDEYNDFFGY